jgi:hypothetical protein
MGRPRQPNVTAAIGAAPWLPGDGNRPAPTAAQRACSTPVAASR